MLRTLLIPATILLSALHSQPAQAADYPVLTTYGALAQELIQGTNAVVTAQDATGVQTRTRDLVKLGVDIMALYGSKNPNCQAQFDQMISELPQMESMTLDEAMIRYHDGRGLPAAPRHCYFGRSQVVHPVANIIRLNSPWSDLVRGDVVADFNEVIEHLKRIQKNLDNPPN